MGDHYLVMFCEFFEGEGRGEKRRKCKLILRYPICYCLIDGYLTGGRRDYVSVGLTTNHNQLLYRGDSTTYRAF